MDFTTGQYVQLIIALFSGVAIFSIAYIAPVRYIVSFIVITIPFQPITSIYGSINMVLIYLAAVALLIRGEIRLFPLLWAVMGILLAYALSLSQTLGQTYFDHFLYLVSIGSNFLLFYMVYNYFRKDGDLGYALNLFVWVATVVNIYFLISMLVGFDHVSFMGIEELSMGQNIESLQRLVGPFNAPGTNAEFLAIQILFLGYILLYERRKFRRLFLFTMLLAAFGFLVATGSRGGIVALFAGAVLFLFLFRKELGVAGLARAVVAAFALGLIAVMITQFTQFNVLFDRLVGTEFEGIVPETRVGAFEHALERIKDKPVLGHGPRIILLHEEERRIPGYQPFGGYPHSLYLFLLYTVGAVGLVAYIIFFVALLKRWSGVLNTSTQDAVLRDIPKLAIVLMVVFLFSQFRIEFLRFILNDYQNYSFALWGTLLAFSDQIRSGKTPKVEKEVESTTGKSRILFRKRNTCLAGTHK